MVDPKIAFGKRVRLFRSRLEWSQEELAHESGLHRTYVGGVERGERNVSLTNICRLATALGVTPSKLMDFQIAGSKKRS